MKECCAGARREEPEDEVDVAKYILLWSLTKTVDEVLKVLYFGHQ